MEWADAVPLGCIKCRFSVRGCGSCGPNESKARRRSEELYEEFEEFEDLAEEEPKTHSHPHTTTRDAQVKGAPTALAPSNLGVLAAATATPEDEALGLVMAPGTKTGYKGVYQRHKSRFEAEIRVPGKGIQKLGTFDNAREAAVAFARAHHKLLTTGAASRDSRWALHPEPVGDEGVKEAQDGSCYSDSFGTFFYLCLEHDSALTVALRFDVPVGALVKVNSGARGNAQLRGINAGPRSIGSHPKLERGTQLELPFSWQQKSAMVRSSPPAEIQPGTGPYSKSNWGGFYCVPKLEWCTEGHSFLGEKLLRHLPRDDQNGHRGIFPVEGTTVAWRPPPRTCHTGQETGKQGSLYTMTTFLVLHDDGGEETITEVAAATAIKAYMALGPEHHARRAMAEAGAAKEAPLFDLPYQPPKRRKRGEEAYVAEKVGHLGELSEEITLESCRSAVSRSGFKGVYVKSRGNRRFQAEIRVPGSTNRGTKTLGSYDTAEEAALVVAREYRLLHGKHPKPYGSGPQEDVPADPDDGMMHQGDEASLMHQGDEASLMQATTSVPPGPPFEKPSVRVDEGAGGEAEASPAFGGVKQEQKEEAADLVEEHAANAGGKTDSSSLHGALLSTASNTGYKGVYLASTGKYQTRICLEFQKRPVNVGTFDTLEEAVQAYAEKREFVDAAKEERRKNARASGAKPRKPTGSREAPHRGKVPSSEPRPRKDRSKETAARKAKMHAAKAEAARLLEASEPQGSRKAKPSSSSAGASSSARKPRRRRPASVPSVVEAAQHGTLFEDRFGDLVYVCGSPVGGETPLDLALRFDLPLKELLRVNREWYLPQLKMTDKLTKGAQLQVPLPPSLRKGLWPSKSEVRVPPPQRWTLSDHSWINRRTQRRTGADGNPSLGHVVAFRPDDSGTEGGSTLWHIVDDDGEECDLAPDEVHAAMKLFANERQRAREASSYKQAEEREEGYVKAKQRTTPCAPVQDVQPGETCVICMEDMHPVKEIPHALTRLGTCLHIFHSTCLISCCSVWKEQCPLCKVAFSRRVLPAKRLLKEAENAITQQQAEAAATLKSREEAEAEEEARNPSRLERGKTRRQTRVLKTS